MFITNENYANKIVDTNKSLFWEGWNIVEFKPASDAYYSPQGAFHNGKWGYKNVFALTEQGWKVPKKYARG